MRMTLSSLGCLLLVGTVACNPPLAATPTAAPPPPTAAAAAATTAPAAPAQGAPASATAAPAAPAQAAAPTSAPAAPAGGDPDVVAATAKYYDAAKKEGKLVLYGVGNETLYNPIRDAFMKRFPGIEVQGVDQRGRE